MLPVPIGAISLRSADDSPLNILGYTRFVLTLGDKSLPVEALVIPHSGSDAMLTDNSIMKAFDVKLEWAAEKRSFRDNNITISAIHTKKPITSQYCSIIKQKSATFTPVSVSYKYVVPRQHEAVVGVFITARPQTDTLALAKPKIVMGDTIKSTPQDGV